MKEKQFQQSCTYAALTGDIIDSTKLSNSEIHTTWETIKVVVEDFSIIHADTFEGGVDFYRGDSWQLLLRKPKYALRLALLIRARIRAEVNIDTRISIGMGLVNEINENRISMSQGEAFVLSGHSLDDISGYFAFTGELPKRAGDLRKWFPVMLFLCSEIVESWTRRQAEIVSKALLLDKPTHSLIAKSLIPVVKKQTVSDSLRGANWRVLQETIAVFEETNWQKLCAE